MVARKGMEHMTGYGQGYVPPKGNAGGSAKGDYSHKNNPLAVPKKGSHIGAASDFGNAADRMKVQNLKDEQARKESQRGC